MQYLLEYNTFKFDGNFYQQISETSMGTKMAYATVFVHKLEKTLKPLTCIRCIDDIFCPWTHGRHLPPRPH